MPRIATRQVFPYALWIALPLCARAASPVPEVGPTAPFALRDGVLVDPARELLYVMNATGGIDAVAVTTGRTVWHASGVERPLLLLEGGRLLAQGEPQGPGEIPLALLDAASGRTLASLAVPIPRDIEARIDEQLMSVFEVGARSEGPEVLLAWRHTRRAHKGVRADRTISQQDARVRIDLASGRVEPVPATSWPSPWARPLPAPAAEAAGRSLATAAAKGGAVPADGLSPVWSGDLVYAALRLSPDRARTRVQRWDRLGQPLPEISLASAPGDLRHASADGRHLLASSAVDPSGPTWQWSLFSLASGERVAGVTLPVSAAPFFLLGSTLVHAAPPFGQRVDGSWTEVPRRLVAVSSASGAAIWSLPIRDTAYVGPDVPQR